AFTAFLAGAVTGLNVAGFAGSNWRLPTLAELQTVVLDFECTGEGQGPTCSCPSSPCVEPTLDTANTQSDFYWSATERVEGFHAGFDAWFVSFSNGFVLGDAKLISHYVRAVRGGL